MGCHTHENQYANKIKKVQSVTLVEGDPKAPFSIGNTPRFIRVRYSIP